MNDIFHATIICLAVTAWLGMGVMAFKILLHYGEKLVGAPCPWFLRPFAALVIFGGPISLVVTTTFFGIAFLGRNL